MKIKIVTVGKLKERYLKDGIAEYTKRISRFAKLEMIELTDEKTPDKASELENQKKISNVSVVVPGYFSCLDGLPIECYRDI